MTTSRRTFFKMAGVAATALPISAQAQAPARAPGNPTPPGVVPGLTCATIVTPSGSGLGVRTPAGVLDVRAAGQALKRAFPTSVDDVIQGRGDLAALMTLVRDGARSRPFMIPEAQVRFGPCVTEPEKILCVGLNYRSHIAETNAETPKAPIFFNKFNTSLNGHGGSIPVSADPTGHFDYEAELVIVIGKTARNVPVKDALSYAFGYCTGQDFTARTVQFLTSQWMLGKCGDGWGPIGPWLVSADQVDPDNLNIEMRVNGDVRQSSNTKMMIYSCSQLISYASQHMTLHPGDLIFTGTPDGVIMGQPADKQVWLKKGDRLTTQIEKLGAQDIILT